MSSISAPTFASGREHCQWYILMPLKRSALPQVRSLWELSEQEENYWAPCKIMTKADFSSSIHPCRERTAGKNPAVTTSAINTHCQPLQATTVPRRHFHHKCTVVLIQIISKADLRIFIFLLYWDNLNPSFCLYAFINILFCSQILQYIVCLLHFQFTYNCT